jgi:hypothetical protein
MMGILSEDFRKVGLALNSLSQVERHARGQFSDVGKAPASSLGAHLDPHQESTSHLKRAGEETLPEGFILDTSAVAADSGAW